jgi:hypothetical protein
MKISLADPRFQYLSDAVVQAQSLVSQGEYPEAKRTFLDCLRETERLGVVSGDVLWGLAVVSDYLGEFGDAVRYCRTALESDPLSPSYRRSWAVISRRVREALLDASRPESNPAIPQLHAAAVEAGVADDDSRLRVARHFVVTGRVEHARHFLEALTTLSPGCSEAWLMLADIGMKIGDEQLVERCVIAVGRRPELLPTQSQAEA